MRVVVGNIFEDAWGVITDAGGAVLSLPGLAQVTDVVTSVVDGPVRDFARSSVGRVVLSAIATSLSSGLVPYVGPQLMTVAWALPGMAAGDDFLTAWTQEVGRRAEQTAEIMGGDAAKQFADQIEVAARYLRDSGVDPASVTFQWLANQLGIRQDSAAEALAAARHVLADALGHFNPLTGNATAVTGTVNAVRQYSTWTQDRRNAIAERAAVTKASSFVDDNPELRRAAPAPAPTYRVTAPAEPKHGIAIPVTLALAAAALGFVAWQKKWF